MLFILIPLQFHLGKLALYLSKNIKALWKEVRLYKACRKEENELEKLKKMREKIISWCK
jgi:hypothetical protein